jgi:SNF2 family DNA or RNA helicase
MRLSLDRGFFKLHGAPGKNDKAFSRKLWRDVCSAARWHGGHKVWRMPATPAVAEAFADKFEMELPPGIEDLVKFEKKAAVAMEKANKLRELPVEKLRAMLDKREITFDRKPYDHQVVGVVYVLANPRCALFYDTGTGKTFTAAVVIQALVDLKGVSKVIVIAPKSILRVGWGDDIDKFTNLRWADISSPPAPAPVNVCPECDKVFKKMVSKQHIKTHTTDYDKWYEEHPETRPAGSYSKQERVAIALKGDAQIFLINPEAFKGLIDEMTEVNWDMAIIDESSMLKSPTSIITDKCIEFGSSIKRKLIMSGTPRPNDALDLWGQISFLEPGLYPSFPRFREKYFESDFNGWSWRERPGAREEIQKMLAVRSLRVRLDDCVDLPGESYVDVEVELEGEHWRHYQTMLRDMLVELEEETIDTSYQLVQMNKLAQITSGFIYDEDKKPHYFDDNPKMREAVRLANNLIVNEGRSVVIWVRFPKIEGTALANALAPFGVSTLYGGTKDVEKSVRAFKSGKNKVMIAHPLSAKFGHTWVEHCNVAIFFSYDYSWENYYQAKRRIYRIGQTKPVTYINIIAKRTVDNVILKRLKEKEESSALMLDARDVADLRMAL